MPQIIHVKNKDIQEERAALQVNISITHQDRQTELHCSAVVFYESGVRRLPDGLT
jgi:hypothetical protein